ncbi:MAG: hypothetical protein AAGI46_02615 [Planctomycetota bacterium]
MTSASSSITLDYTINSVSAYTPYFAVPGDGGFTSYEESVNDPATVYVISQGQTVLSRGMIGVNFEGDVFKSGDVLTSTTAPSGSLVYDVDLDLSGVTLSGTSGAAFTVEAKSLIPGDFNGDQIVDSDDIDLLANRVATSPLANDMFDEYDLETDMTITFDHLVASDASIVIRDVLSTEFGDANLDGMVDLADFGLLNANFGSSGGWAQGDFDGNGTVNLADFGILNTYFGFGGSRSTSAMLLRLTIPEPTFALSVIGFAVFGIARRR